MPTTPPDPSSLKIELLRAAYVAFNVRDIDAALALMTPDVAWPRAFKGGFVRGPEEVRAYWTEQWSEIDPHVEPLAFHPEDAGRILVEVHQVVRDKAGALLADDRVGHRFTLEQGLIQGMEICSLPSANCGDEAVMPSSLLFLAVSAGLTAAVCFFFHWPVALTALLFFVVWPLVGTLVTADDDLPGGWSNPDGTIQPPWKSARFWADVVFRLAVVFAASAVTAGWTSQAGVFWILCVYAACVTRLDEVGGAQQAFNQRQLTMNVLRNHHRREGAISAVPLS